jgi:hypothetical protein
MLASTCEAINSGVPYRDAGIHHGMDLYFVSDANPDMKGKVESQSFSL